MDKKIMYCSDCDKPDCKHRVHGGGCVLKEESDDKVEEPGNEL